MLHMVVRLSSNPQPESTESWKQQRSRKLPRQLASKFDSSARAQSCPSRHTAGSPLSLRMFVDIHRQHSEHLGGSAARYGEVAVPLSQRDVEGRRPSRTAVRHGRGLKQLRNIGPEGTCSMQVRLPRAFAAMLMLGRLSAIPSVMCRYLISRRVRPQMQLRCDFRLVQDVVEHCSALVRKLLPACQPSCVCISVASLLSWPGDQPLSRHGLLDTAA